MVRTVTAQVPEEYSVLHVAQESPFDADLFRRVVHLVSLPAVLPHFGHERHAFIVAVFVQGCAYLRLTEYLNNVSHTKTQR